MRVCNAARTVQIEDDRIRNSSPNGNRDRKTGGRGSGARTIKTRARTGPSYGRTGAVDASRQPRDGLAGKANRNGVVGRSIGNGPRNGRRGRSVGLGVIGKCRKSKRTTGLERARAVSSMTSNARKTKRTERGRAYVTRGRTCVYMYVYAIRRRFSPASGPRTSENAVAARHTPSCPRDVVFCAERERWANTGRVIDAEGGREGGGEVRAIELCKTNLSSRQSVFSALVRRCYHALTNAVVHDERALYFHESKCAKPIDFQCIYSCRHTCV